MFDPNRPFKSLSSFDENKPFEKLGFDPGKPFEVVEGSLNNLKVKTVKDPIVIPPKKMTGTFVEPPKKEAVPLTPQEITALVKNEISKIPKPKQQKVIEKVIEKEIIKEVKKEEKKDTKEFDFLNKQISDLKDQHETFKQIVPFLHGGGGVIGLPNPNGNGGKTLQVVNGQWVPVDVSSSGTSIGGPITGGTTGSVLFVNPSGTIAEDNANFFWDATNNRLAIGLIAPAAKAHIISTTQQLRIGYDTSNYYSTAVSSAGNVVLTTFGTTPLLTLNTRLTQNYNPGTYPASAVRAFLQSTQASGDAGGTTNLRAFENQVLIDGANNLSAAYGCASAVYAQGSGGTLNSQNGYWAYLGVTSAMGVGTANMYQTGGTVTGAGNIGALNYFAASPLSGYSSTGDITGAITGINLSLNISRAAATTFTGVHVGNQTKGSGNMISYRGAIAAATGAWNLYMDGTAQNYLAGNLGIGVTVPTSVLHLKAGTATANTAPLKFNTGALLTAPEAGAVEFLTDSYYVTTTTGTIRRMVVAGTTGRATGQTAANASVATYTLGAADATYEVSANVLVTTSSAEAFTVTCAYTDEGNTARTATLNFSLVSGAIGTNIAFANGAVPYMGIALNIRCKASTSITVATTGTFTGATYNVAGVIKQVA